MVKMDLNKIIEIQHVSAISSPQNRVIIIKDFEVTIRIAEVTSPDATEAMLIWENSVW